MIEFANIIDIIPQWLRIIFATENTEDTEGDEEKKGQATIAFLRIISFLPRSGLTPPHACGALIPKPDKPEPYRGLC